MLDRVSEREFFTLNCSKFAVECDWNRKNSQNVPNLGFFEKIDGIFRKKTLNFFKIAECGIFFWNASQIVILLSRSSSGPAFRADWLWKRPASG